jgi:hypothetical protein
VPNSARVTAFHRAGEWVAGAKVRTWSRVERACTRVVRHVLPVSR